MWSSRKTDMKVDMSGVEFPKIDAWDGDLNGRRNVDVDRLGTLTLPSSPLKQGTLLTRQYCGLRNGIEP